jgi:hypothetical protein
LIGTDGVARHGGAMPFDTPLQLSQRCVSGDTICFRYICCLPLPLNTCPVVLLDSCSLAVGSLALHPVVCTSTCSSPTCSAR